MTDPQDRPEAESTRRAPGEELAGDAPAPLPTPVATTAEAVPVVLGEAAAPSAPVAVSARRAPRARQLSLASPYAIIETGGKQYRVSVGDTVAVEKLPHDAGGDVTIDRVLLLGGDGATRVGTPTVAGARVTARVDDHYRGEKIVVFKYKAKKRYRRRTGHRQSLTRLTITGIAG